MKTDELLRGENVRLSKSSLAKKSEKSKRTPVSYTKPRDKQENNNQIKQPEYNFVCDWQQQ